MRRIAILLLAAVVALGVMPVTSARALPDKTGAPTSPTPPAAPPPGLIFNDPTGPRAGQHAIVTQLNRGIDAAPKGALITMTQYLYDQGSTTDALLRAHRRGVRVQVLVDSRARSAALTKLRKGLGTNKSRPGFVVTCRQSCMATATSIMHAKFFLFSRTGSQLNTSMITSANPHTVNTEDSWNNLHTIANNKVLYTSLRRYFTDMLADRTNLNYYRTTSSGIYKLYLYPRTVRRSSDIVLLDVLNHVSCKKVTKGYGRQGRTQIRVAMLIWTAPRANIARRLWQLHDQGCLVEVITNKARVGPTAMSILLKKSKRNGQLKVYDAWVDGNRDGVGERYVHHKVVTINGRWFGKGNTKVVYTGSQNFTGPGTARNNEVLLRVKHGPTHDAYARHLDGLRKHTKRLR